MPVDGFSPTTALVPSISFTAKAFQIGYELADVPKQANEVLEVIKQVKSDIKHARELRRRKSGMLEAYEKVISDDTIENTEKALARLEELVEPSRADMMTGFGKVSMSSRVTWVLRAANNVNTALIRLNNISGALNREMGIMRCRGQGGGKGGREEKNGRSDQGDGQSPPPYDAVKEFMHLSRQMTILGNPSTPTSPLFRQSPNGAELLRPNSYPEALMSFGDSYPSGSIYELPGSEAAYVQLSGGDSPFPSAVFSAPRESNSISNAMEQYLDEPQIMDSLPQAEFAMETETLIPGRREPLLLRWNEPNDLMILSRALDSPRTGPLTQPRQQSWLEYQASRPPTAAEDFDFT